MSAPDSGDARWPRPMPGQIPESYGYDEVGTRTRQAWLRTSLVIVVLALLAVRVLIVGGHPLAVVMLPVLPAAAMLTVAGLRSHRLRNHESEPVPRWMIAVTVGGSVALAIIVVIGATLAAA